MFRLGDALVTLSSGPSNTLWALSAVSHSKRLTLLPSDSPAGIASGSADRSPRRAERFSEDNCLVEGSVILSIQSPAQLVVLE